MKLKDFNYQLVALILVSLISWIGIGSCVYSCSEKVSTIIKQEQSELDRISDEWELCFRWAFGETYGSVTDDSDFPDLWNQRHGDIFIILGTDNQAETNKRIFEAWQNRQKKEILSTWDTTPPKGSKPD